MNSFPIKRKKVKANKGVFVIDDSVWYSFDFSAKEKNNISLKVINSDLISIDNSASIN